MSRAFVKEVEHEIDDLPDRPVSTHPNLVTAEGLAAIERTLARFQAANKAAIGKRPDSDGGYPARTSLLDYTTFERAGCRTNG